MKSLFETIYHVAELIFWLAFFYAVLRHNILKHTTKPTRNIICIAIFVSAVAELTARYF